MEDRSYKGKLWTAVAKNPSSGNYLVRLQYTVSTITGDYLTDDRRTEELRDKVEEILGYRLAEFFLCSRLSVEGGNRENSFYRCNSASGIHILEMEKKNA